MREEELFKCLMGFLNHVLPSGIKVLDGFILKCTLKLKLLAQDTDLFIKWLFVESAKCARIILSAVLSGKDFKNVMAQQKWLKYI